jgi:tripartite-type tricarboxylate transporter receptor subunit TctC
VDATSVCRFFVLATAIATQQAGAQDYPTRPIRFVTPYAPGAGTDETARFVAAKLSEQLKQTVVVENKGGAGGLIATRDVLRATPVGYSLLLGAPVILTNLFAYKNPGYKWEDFATVGVLSIAPYAMIMNHSIPARTVGELVAYARANPTKLNYGSVGPGYSTILTERFKEAAQIQMVQVLFKGGAPLNTALLAGDIHIYVVNVSTARLRIQNSQIVGLAVTGEARSRLMPDLPTFKELGYPTLAGLSYFDSVLVPSAAPPSVIAKLRSAMAQVSSTREMRERLQKMERDPWSGTLEEFDAYLKQDAAALAVDFKKLNIPLID